MRSDFGAVATRDGAHEPRFATDRSAPTKGDLFMLTRDEDVLAAAESWREAGRDVAIATVVETWGSAPRPIGSHLVIDAEGNFLGSVSGGCVEGAVVEEAADVIANGLPRML